MLNTIVRSIIILYIRPTPLDIMPLIMIFYGPHVLSPSCIDKAHLRSVVGINVAFVG